MPHALRLNGTSITGWDRSRCEREDGTAGEGWVFVTAEQFAAAQTTTRPQWIEGEVVEGPEPPPPPPAPLRVSKLKLRRVLREAGAEPLLDAFLAGDPQMMNDWRDSSFLSTDDPLLTAAIAQFAEATGMTTEQVMALLETAADTEI